MGAFQDSITENHENFQELFETKDFDESIHQIKIRLSRLMQVQMLQNIPLQSIMKFHDLLAKDQSRQKSRYLISQTYLCMAMASQICGCDDAQWEYQSAHDYDQHNSQVNLLFAIFLFRKRCLSQALRHIHKVELKQLFSKQNKFVIESILERAYAIFNYFQKFQMRTPLKVEEIIAQNQFLSKFEKIKNQVFYRIKDQNSCLKLCLQSFINNKFSDGLVLAQNIRLINHPPTQIIQMLLASLFFLLNKKEESIQCAKQSLRINPKNQLSRLLLLLGQQLNGLGKQQAKHHVIISLKNLQQFSFMGLNKSLIQKFIIQPNKQVQMELIKKALSQNPSELTYFLLGLNQFYKGKIELAQRYLLQSIKIRPIFLNCFQLALLYQSKDMQLNAVICYFQAIKKDCTQFSPYLILGKYTLKGIFFKSIINNFFDFLIVPQANKLFLQTGLAIYNLISNQSQNQIWTFLRNFIEERRSQCEEVPFSDISCKLISPIYQNIMINCQNIIYLLIIGVLRRSKGRYSQSHKIYSKLISKYKDDIHTSLLIIFTEIYEDKIKSIPRQFLKIFCEFLVAEMVQENLEQAIKCFYKSLSYASGEYEQFYLEIYKKVQSDIKQIQLGESVSNYVIDTQYLSKEDCNEFLQEKTKELTIRGLKEYIQSLVLKNQIEKQIRQQAENEEESQQLQPFFIQKIEGLLLLKGTVKPQKLYNRLFTQIQTEQNMFVQNIKKTHKIYKKNTKMQRRSLLLNSYFDAFTKNQTINFIFNHFHPYIISKKGHKQFAYILQKIKNCSYYRFNEMMQDIQRIFLEGNRHTNEQFRVFSIQVSQSINVINEDDFSIIDVDANSQNSQTENKRNNQYQLFEDEGYWNEDRKLEPSISNTSKENNRQSGPNKYGIFKNMPKRVKAQKQLESSEDECIEDETQSKIPQLQEEYQSNIFQDQQRKWYEQDYQPMKRKFSSNKLYEKFNNFLFFNTFFLIKYLSKQTTRYIAQHICETKQISPNQKFKFKVQHGDIIDSQYNIRLNVQERSLQSIQNQGLNNIFSWIADIALGILQMECLGIYHADLFFRNTIRVKKGREFMFKIIDFDKAFKVFPTESNDKGYECTKDLFDFWLRFKFNGPYSRAPIYDLASKSNSSTQKSSTQYDEKDVIDYIFVGADKRLVQQLLEVKHGSIFSSKRISKCLDLLRKHMRVSHLKQYSALVERVVKKHQEQKLQSIEQQRVDAVLEELQLLKKGQIEYAQFSRKVRQIGNIKDDSESEND